MQKMSSRKGLGIDTCILDRPTLFYGAIDILHVLRIHVVSTANCSIRTVTSLQREYMRFTLVSRALSLR